MWPFRKRVRVSDAVDQFRQTKEKVFQLMARLDTGDSSVTDDAIRNAYSNLAGRMQSNCDSVAQGLLTIIASLCAHRRHLTPELLPDAMEPLYFLGIEDYEGFARYFNWLAGYDEPYLGAPTQSGREYLRELSASEEILRDAFKTMFEKQNNEWRNSDEDVGLLPAILQATKSEQDTADPI